MQSCIVSDIREKANQKQFLSGGDNFIIYMYKIFLSLWLFFPSLTFIKSFFSFSVLSFILFHFSFTLSFFPQCKDLFSNSTLVGQFSEFTETRLRQSSQIHCKSSHPPATGACKMPHSFNCCPQTAPVNFLVKPFWLFYHSPVLRHHVASHCSSCIAADNMQAL